MAVIGTIYIDHADILDIPYVSKAYWSWQHLVKTTSGVEGSAKYWDQVVNEYYSTPFL